MFSVFGFVYMTGLHVPLAASLQRIIISTGIVKPDIDLDENEKVEVDYDFQLTDVNGNLVRFEAFKGKVIFLNFWATWCPPCLAEMPDIDHLYAEINKEEIAFVMISSDENFETAKNFISKKGYKFPIYQLRTALPDALRSTSIPTTFVLSKNGQIEAKRKGFASYNNDTFIAFLKTLMARK